MTRKIHTHAVARDRPSCITHRLPNNIIEGEAALALFLFRSLLQFSLTSNHVRTYTHIDTHTAASLPQHTQLHRTPSKLRGHYLKKFHQP